MGGGRDHEEHQSVETRIRKAMSNPWRDIDIVMLAHQFSLIVQRQDTLALEDMINLLLNVMNMIFNKSHRLVGGDPVVNALATRVFL